MVNSRSLLLDSLVEELRKFRGDYDESKSFSTRWDEKLGFRKDSVEDRLKRSPTPSGEQAWVGLPLPSLETPYPELYQAWSALHNELSTDFRCVDLGAAYGRVGVLQLALFPGSRFTGYELLGPRAEEGNRIFHVLGLQSSASLLTENLADREDVPAAEVYFIYDLGSVARIRNMLALLQVAARERTLIVIGRGRATRHLIETENAWLSQVHPPIHFENLSVYFSGERLAPGRTSR